MTNARGEMRTARGLFWHQKQGEVYALGKRTVFSGGSGASLSLFVSGQRLPNGDFLIVMSNRESAILERYGKRWGIETLFGCLKKRGFNLEATHVTATLRLSRLLAVLTLAFCWAYVSGRWLFAQKPWQTKKHGRLTVSLFRAGLDWLQSILMPLCGNKSQEKLEVAARFLSCT